MTNVPVFYMALGLVVYMVRDVMILMRKNPLLGLLPFQGQKSLDFQSPPLPMALKMDFPASKSLRPAPYKQQVH
jgi:hypothetical protein